MLTTIWDIGYKLLGVIIGLTVAVLVYWLVPITSATEKFVLSLLGSLLSVVIVEFLKQSVQVKDLTKICEEASKKVNRLEQNLGSLNSSLADRFRASAQLEALLRYRTETIPSGRMDEVWLELIWGIRSEYLATNYINAPALYRTGYAGSALAIQSTKIKTMSAKIRKVFIVDSDNELNEIRDILTQQKEAGIEVKYIHKKKIDANQGLAAKCAHLETIDFGLFDSHVLLLWFLGKKKRSVEEGKVLVGGNFEDYKIFFNSLYNEAREFRSVMLATLTRHDQDAIRAWPAYPPQYKDLDYALRERGWLDQFPAGAKNHRFAAWQKDELLGFSILTETGNNDAEFYLAVRPERLRKGFGKEITQMTLDKAFYELGLERVHLKVRKWHRKAIELYTSSGFKTTGLKDEEINGKTDTFEIMELNRSDY